MNATRLALLPAAVLLAGAGCSLRPAALATPAAPAATLTSAPDQHFTNGDVTIRYRAFGQGPPLVLLHGFAADMMMWGAYADSLALSHRVIALDIRGHGQSDKPPGTASYGLRMGEDAIRLLDHLGIRRAHFAGLSMGGLLAANLAVRYPARVNSVTVIAAPMYPDSVTFVREVGRFLSDMREGRGLLNFLQWVLPDMPREMALRFNQQMMQAFDMNLLSAIFESNFSLAVPDPGRQPVPAFFIVGDGDPLLPLTREMARRWPGSTAALIAGANHISILARPELLAGIRRMTRARN